ncbi:MAG TPA: hypothetical protein PKD86_11170 [Gemmatales bacterium]|nr:hypothetical protein [Gemmatales bacterium]HMP59906.1 hypothetical protein [Gemmatales bacterium]
MGMSWGGPTRIGISYVAFHAVQLCVARAGLAASADPADRAESASDDLDALVRRLDRRDPIRLFVMQGETGALELDQCHALAQRLGLLLEKLLTDGGADDCLDAIDWLQRE